MASKDVFMVEDACVQTPYRRQRWVSRWCRKHFREAEFVWKSASAPLRKGISVRRMIWNEEKIHQTWMASRWSRTPGFHLPRHTECQRPKASYLQYKSILCSSKCQSSPRKLSAGNDSLAMGVELKDRSIFFSSMNSNDYKKTFQPPASFEIWYGLLKPNATP